MAADMFQRCRLVCTFERLVLGCHVTGSLTNLRFRSWLAENWRRRGKFEDVSFVFPSAPMIPITVVCVSR